MLYYTARSIYRLYFHPLAKVPGPWLAAISSLYEFYWDCLKSGRFHTKINWMHDQYAGSIVRINPWEVHINNPAYVDTLYNNNKLDKDFFVYGCFGTDTASFSTVDGSTHRMRRDPMGPFFSRANVRKLEYRVLARVRQLCDRIVGFAAEDQPFCIGDAYRCLAADVVTDFAMPETKTLLAHPDFASKFVQSIRDLSRTIIWNRHLRILTPILANLPRALVVALDRSGEMTGVVDMNLDVQHQAKMVTEGRSTKDYPTVLNAIYTSTSLSPHERDYHRIADETLAIMAAGTETTGATLAHLTYHVLSNPRILQTLKAELNKAAAEHNVPRTELLDCSIVEGIPYLQALMKETLRYATPITGRLPRRNSTAPMVYTSPSGTTYVLPPGTSISMTPRDLHFNPAIFASPYEYKPERWLPSITAPEDLARMNKYLMPFGKGARICLGIELAKQEILLTAGNLFWKFEFELWKTGPEEVAYVHDFFGAWARTDSKGVRVRVSGM
ncbi:putative cytochrome P450 [Bimuria novae-zelandiae CBS 107.79]|uniref:Putative cytochrome P450 n=1 Tax=Bimuria novae-zelandiae CBS 107.79 TaxID=1447943 RepID=A0A6A5V8Y0_9PLEO|nr:putative cytochrome P450 [Bimuria novae-zelandiae CBS 107.79]